MSDLKSSLDVWLNVEQGYVSMVVDMAIAEKVEVYVGNGVSSFHSLLFPFSFFVPSTVCSPLQQIPLTHTQTVLKPPLKQSDAVHGKRA